MRRRDPGAATPPAGACCGRCAVYGYASPTAHTRYREPRQFVDWLDHKFLSAAFGGGKLTFLWQPIQRVDTNPTH